MSARSVTPSDIWIGTSRSTVTPVSGSAWCVIDVSLRRSGQSTSPAIRLVRTMSRTPPFSELFEREKPVIAMAHLPPLPGTPLYDEASGVAGIVEAVRADLGILLAAGVDAVLFCNEGDRPYALRAGPEGIAVLARVVAELAPGDRPYGVDFLWDARAALAVAAATGAAFIREVTTGVYESDMGLWNTDAAGLLRERRRLGADNVRVLMNVKIGRASCRERVTIT